MKARRLLEALAVLVCLGLVALINVQTREPAPGIRWYTGGLGEQVSTPFFGLTVDSVQIAQRVEYSATAMDAQGVLVVVEWSIEGTDRPGTASVIELHTANGLQIADRGNFSLAMQNSITPGFTAHSTSVFHVPQGEEVGADFIVHANRGTMYTFGASVRIDDIVDADTPRTDLAVLAAPEILVTR